MEKGCRSELCGTGGICSFGPGGGDLWSTAEALKGGEKKENMELLGRRRVMFSYRARGQEMAALAVVWF